MPVTVEACLLDSLGSPAASGLRLRQDLDAANDSLATDADAVSRLVNCFPGADDKTAALIATVKLSARGMTAPGRTYDNR